MNGLLHRAFTGNLTSPDEGSKADAIKNEIMASLEGLDRQGASFKLIISADDSNHKLLGLLRPRLLRYAVSARASALDRP